MGTILQDLKYAFRTLRLTPSFSAIAIVMLALGIGANTAIFSVIHSVLLRPLPYAKPDRLAMVYERRYREDSKKNVINPVNFNAWRERAKSFESLSAMYATEGNVGRVDPERVPIAIISPDLMQTAGAQAIVGRTLRPDEENAQVALISESLWRRRFNADPSIIGKQVDANGKLRTVVGVMPRSFELPEKVDVWTPWTTEMKNSRGRFMTAIGRLRPGVTVEQAQAEMKTICANLERERPDYDTGWDAVVIPLRDDIVGDIRPALFVLLAAVAFVMLIVCVNVGNLLIVRGAIRSREIAVRLALGITRARLVRQLLTESLLLSVLGGLTGVAVGFIGLRALLAMVPKNLPGFADVHLNMTVLAFALLLSVITGVVFGIAPVFQAMHVSSSEALKSGARTAGGAASRRRIRNIFVIAESALALILLVGAGLLVRSFVQLVNIDMGFRTGNVLTMKVALSGEQYREDAQLVAFFTQAVERMKSLPGVKAAGAISYLPLTLRAAATGFSVDDNPTRDTEQPGADVRSVTGDYFKAMGIGLLRGRTFDDSDRATDKLKKIVVNETLARRFWPNQDPIGKTITMEWGGELHAQVVGVVRDVKLTRLQGEAYPAIYWYLPQFPVDGMTFVLYTSGSPTAVAAEARGVLKSVDPTQAVGHIQTMDEVVSDAVRASRFLTVLIAIFAGLALLLACIGLYGVISYMVAQRTQEIGLRMAFGATRENIARVVLSEGMTLIGVGIAVGLIGSLLLTRYLATLLFNVNATDMFTYASVSALLTVVALAACYLPARRAMRVEPVTALRYE